MTQTSSSSRTGLDLDPLRAGFAGEILTAADGDAYDAVRVAYNAMFDRRPAVIARATSAADVAHAIGYARGERTDARRARRRPLRRRLLHHRGRPAPRPRPDEGHRGRPRRAGWPGSSPASSGASSTAPPRRTGWPRPAGG